MAVNRNTVYSNREFLFRVFHGPAEGGAIPGYDCTSPAGSWCRALCWARRKVKEQEERMICNFNFRMRTKLSVFCSLVLPCLGLMQPCAAREFMTSPQIDDAFEELRRMIASSVTAAVPITRKVRHRKSHYAQVRQIINVTWVLHASKTKPVTFGKEDKFDKVSSLLGYDAVWVGI